MELYNFDDEKSATDGKEHIMADVERKKPQPPNVVEGDGKNCDGINIFQSIPSNLVRISIV